jgi:hypothetical protein
MPNGSKTTRDYVIEIHTKMEGVKEWQDKHEKAHKFWWFTLLAIPTAVYYVIKILGG